MNVSERKKLNLLFEYAPELKLAYTFREELTAIFEMQLTKLGNDCSSGQTGSAAVYSPVLTRS